MHLAQERHTLPYHPPQALLLDKNLGSRGKASLANGQAWLHGHGQVAIDRDTGMHDVKSVDAYCKIVQRRVLGRPSAGAPRKHTAELFAPTGVVECCDRYRRYRR